MGARCAKSSSAESPGQKPTKAQLEKEVVELKQSYVESARELEKIRRTYDGNGKNWRSPVVAEGSSAAFSNTINSVVEHLWPKISEYTNQILAEEVEPQLQANLPNAFKSMHFELDKCSLGSRPLQFRSVTLEQETKQTVLGPIDNLALYCDVEWVADCSIVLRCGALQLGIDSLNARGCLTVEMVGMMSKLPMFEGIRIFFANPPELELKFLGTGAGFLNSNLVKKKIMEVFDLELSNALVLPNRVGFALVPEVELFRIIAPPAEGVLSLTVISAADLLAADFPWFSWVAGSKGSSDPFVRVTLGARQFRSKTVKRSLNPRFDYTEPLPVADATGQTVTIEVYDEDKLNSDDWLGQVVIPVTRLIEQGSQQIKLDLEDEDGKTGKNGSVTISAEWRQTFLDANHTMPSGIGLVYAGVYHAEMITNHDPRTTYWVAISCSNLLEGFEPTEPQETLRLTQYVTPTFVVEKRLDVAGATLQQKLEALAKYNMSDADMATLLSVDPSAIAKTKASRASLSSAAESLAATSNVSARWDSCKEFLVEDSSKAVLTFELFCCASNVLSKTKSLGKVTFEVNELHSSTACTVIRFLALNKGVPRLKVRCQLRHLGPPSTQMGTENVVLTHHLNRWLGSPGEENAPTTAVQGWA